MFYVYILESLKDGRYYIGQTTNITNRLERHNDGYVRSTRSRRPWRLAFYEEFESRAEAMDREKELKEKRNKKSVAINMMYSY